MRPASLYRRMAAWVYEGLLLFALCAITGLIFSLATHSTHALAHHTALGATLFVVMGAYFSWFWSKGQTLAMKTWRIKVVDLADRPVTLRHATLRYVLAWLWFAPPLIALSFMQMTPKNLGATFVSWIALYILLAWLHPSKQFIHDRLARTRLLAVQ